MCIFDPQVPESCARIAKGSQHAYGGKIGINSQVVRPFPIGAAFQTPYDAGPRLM
jgi:hypothetical protein